MQHEYAVDNPVFFDFETQSPVDLRKCGGHIYAQNPDTRVLSLSALIDDVLVIWLPLMNRVADGIDLPVKYKSLYKELHIVCSPHLPKLICDAVEADRVFAGFNNAHFDNHIWKHCITVRGLGPLPKRWADLLYLGRIAGLPAGGLDTVAKRLIGEEKDSAKRLILPLTMSEYKNGICVHKQILPGLIEPLVRYCSVDTLLLKPLWNYFSNLVVEQDVINTHQRVNERGIRVDLTLAAKIGEVSAFAASKAAKEIEELTDGVLHGDLSETDYPHLKPQERKSNLRSIPQVTEWLESKGVRITDHTGTKTTLRKDAVEKALAHPLSMLDQSSHITMEMTKKLNEVLPVVSRVLRLRSSATRITAAKTDRMSDRRDSDGRIRDAFTYYKAKTGRESSVGVQLHNMTRGKPGVNVQLLLDAHASGQWGSDVEAAYNLVASSLPVKVLKEGETFNARDIVTVDDALAAMIRPCIISDPANFGAGVIGRKLLIADYSKIELCAIAWLAGEDGLIAELLTGADTYSNFASIIYGRKITKKDKEERQLGKVCILGLGYGMGVDKFALSCALQGIDLAKIGVTPERCVDTFRKQFPAICGTYSGVIAGRLTNRRGGFWNNLEEAAKQAIMEPGSLHRVGNHIAYYYDAGVLNCVLPSGRLMKYVGARIEERVPGYVVALGLEPRTKPTIVYTSQYGNDDVLYGAKAAENVSQAVSRDIMVTAKVKLDKVMYVVGAVHDEIIAEDEDSRRISEMCCIMSDPPDWATGFPLDVEGYTSTRYVKEAPKGSLKCHARNGRVLK